MLNRKEILQSLKKLGFNKVSDLKVGCRDYERYYRDYMRKAGSEKRAAIR